MPFAKTMTKSLHTHDSTVFPIFRLITGKFLGRCRLRYIPIVGALCLAVQILLLIVQSDSECKEKICENRNDSYLNRIFFWKLFYRNSMPLPPLCPLEPPDLRKYEKKKKTRMAESQTLFVSCIFCD